ncbi:hypothetical protein O181_097989 [Austropuccinia psidii MF-1]|uniref:Uncharacterized protein n=1 Tax=Austropuccinia psidii MF-1 TaxID=1389203 RepID=A0A9Q3PE39_9BASI|nr:hypothetical protein [Austropuccinia psidii MF-1]
MIHHHHHLNHHHHHLNRHHQDQAQAQAQAQDQEIKRQLIIERVRKQIRLSRAKRTLKTRLSLASFKAARGWQDISFDQIEPHLLSHSRPNPRPTTSQSTTQSIANSITPPRPNQDSNYRADSSNFSQPITPQLSNLLQRPSPPNHPPSCTHSISPFPHTPQQLIRSKWSLNHPSSQTPQESNQLSQDDEDLADQTTAAELMLFLATGSPSPGNRVNKPATYSSTSF